MTFIITIRMKNINSENQITRKEAIKKMSKYAALTAIGTFIILNPKQAQASSPPDPGGNPFE
ncbi:hypothetical protein [Psychroserpens ponticola]|uniref:Twin-arginine translocation signal domain-containing protein n=1 Tax=Psychroserpens ponticola TaxID=2932268 RepID=A0ABY7S2T9_9FLAO|nr:hypothetical protein [Psychroserpens ponticola]WCO03713.1 hypothetical protein MUN68_013900 [Psychroserpens ponticola]